MGYAMLHSSCELRLQAIEITVEINRDSDELPDDTDDKEPYSEADEIAAGNGARAIVKRYWWRGHHHWLMYWSIFCCAAGVSHWTGPMNFSLRMPCLSMM